jgi:hypothetical protein
MVTQYPNFNYLAPAAKRLIPKLAKNYEHLEQIPEIQQAFKDLSANERAKSLEAYRMVGWRLQLAFRTRDEYERDWFIYDARHVIAIYDLGFPVQATSLPVMIVMAKGHPLDKLLRFVQMRLAKRMAVCHRKHCEKKYYFRERRGQKYCSARCAEMVARVGRLRWYHESPKSRKNRTRTGTSESNVS